MADVELLVEMRELASGVLEKEVPANGKRDSYANSRITLDIYTQAVTSAKRQAQTKVVSMILPRRIQAAERGGGN